MSFDLLGRIRVATTGVNGAMGQLNRLTSSLTRTTSQAARMAAGFTGLGGAIGGAVSAAVLFNKTIKAAADYEVREVTVNAMFGKNHLNSAKEYFDLVESRSAVSMFSQSDFLDAGKSFIPTTKDSAQLAKMLNLAERLGAIDPVQGMTGAAYALKELFSGDGLSLVERFELPRAVINDIKKLPLAKQLTVLDKYLDKIGASNELIDAQSKTTMGQYRKSIASVNKAFREMGTEGLEYINPLLEDFNKWLKGADFQRFKTYGIRVFGEFSQGVSESIRKAGRYIDTNFIHNPAFNDLTTISAKVNFVFQTIMDSYNSWLNAGGRDEIKSVATGVVDTMAGALRASGPLIEAAKTIGGALATGVWDGFKKVADEKPELAALMAFLVTPGTAQVKLAAAGLAVAAPSITEAYNIATDSDKTFGEKYQGIFGMDGPIGFNSKSFTDLPEGEKRPFYDPRGWFGRASGLDNVPYDGYKARLHAGETVLTRPEATAYRENGGNGGVYGGKGGGVNVTGNTFIVRQESDIDAIAGKLAHLIAA